MIAAKRHADRRSRGMHMIQAKSKYSYSEYAELSIRKGKGGVTIKLNAMFQSIQERMV